MQDHGAAVLSVQVHGIAFRQAEVRIVQVGHQFRGGLDPLGPVQHQQTLEAVRQQQIRIQRLIQPLLLAADHHQRQGAAVKPGPAQGIGQLLLHAVAGLQPTQGMDRLPVHGGGKPVPGTGHVLRWHVDDPHGQPGFPVHGREELRIRGQAGAEEGAGRQQRGLLPQERRSVGVSVGGKSVSEQLSFIVISTGAKRSGEISSRRMMPRLPDGRWPRGEIPWLRSGRPLG